MFLPDRYIKGECPKCGAKDQYGDSCEVCGAVYAPTDLKNPYSTLSGATPVMSSSEHFFFRLSDPRCVEFLRGLGAGRARCNPKCANKAREWLEGDQGAGRLGHLARRALLRHPDPGRAGQVLLRLAGRADRLPGQPEEPLRQGPGGDADLAGLRRVRGRPGASSSSTSSARTSSTSTRCSGRRRCSSPGRKVPDNVFVHGFITVSGEKMSKSRGTGISPLRYLEIGMNPEWLRYYIAAKLNATRRGRRLQSRRFRRARQQRPGRQVREHRQPGVELPARASSTAQLSDVARCRAWRRARDARRARRRDRRLLRGARLRARAALAMEFADRDQPALRRRKALGTRQGPGAARAPAAGVLGLRRRRSMQLTVWLKPVLPALAARAEAFLGTGALAAWEQARTRCRTRIGRYEHLMTRIDPKQIDALFELPGTAAAAPSSTPAEQPRRTSPRARAKGGSGGADKAGSSAAGKASAGDASSGTITIDDFATDRPADRAYRRRRDRRGLGQAAEADAGRRRRSPPDGVLRHPVGLRAEELIGRLTVMVANLAPRKMKFGVSEGMVLAASCDDPAQPRHLPARPARRCATRHEGEVMPRVG